MCDGQILVIVCSSYHLGQRAGFHQAHHLIGFGVYSDRLYVARVYDDYKPSIIYNAVVFNGGVVGLFVHMTIYTSSRL